MLLALWNTLLDGAWDRFTGSTNLCSRTESNYSSENC